MLATTTIDANGHNGHGAIAHEIELAGQSNTSDAEAIYYPVVQRDPNDVHTILRLAVSSLVFALLAVALSGLLIYKLTRSPSLIVVERSAEGDRVLYAVQKVDR